MKKTELEDILLAFSNKEEEKQQAEEAFILFYREYARYLKTVILKAKNSWPNIDDHVVEVVVNETFLKMYHHPPLSFKMLETESDGDVNNKFKAYLSTTAKRIFYDLLKKDDFIKQKLVDLDKITIDEPTFEFSFEILDIDLNPEIEIGVYQRMLIDILSTFRPRDRQILMTIYQYEEEGKKRPKEVMRELASYHGTSPANIRKIKERRENDIKAYFLKHSDLKPIKS